MLLIYLQVKSYTFLFQRASHIDMNRQSDIMATFEENLWCFLNPLKVAGLSAWARKLCTKCWSKLSDLYHGCQLSALNTQRHYGQLWKHILYASNAILIPLIRVSKPAPVKCKDINLSLLCTNHRSSETPIMREVVVWHPFFTLRRESGVWGRPSPILAIA